MSASQKENESREVTLFRDYIRIKSIQPNPDYQSCVEFLSNIALDIGLPFFIKAFSPDKPIMVATWEGLKPELPSILLNSHMDVVPVVEECWKFDPFEAYKDEHGNIFGRGTQDMKCVTIQQLEAIRRLKNSGKRFIRTVHLCFMVEEETGGEDGMAKFIISEEFKNLNVGLALDEGIASPDEILPIFYGERNLYWVNFICEGNPGHGSRFIENTAAEKVQVLLNTVMKYREEQEKLLESDKTLTLGDVTTVNLTMISGGVQMANKFTLGFDMRITPKTSVKEFDELLDKFADVAGVKYEILIKGNDPILTSISEDYPWFKALKNAFSKSGLQVEPKIFPAGTDAWFFRNAKIPAYGFSPMNNTPILLHNHNEFLNENIFLKGIAIYEDIIESIANV